MNFEYDYVDIQTFSFESSEISMSFYVIENKLYFGEYVYDEHIELINDFVHNPWVPIGFDILKVIKNSSIIGNYSNYTEYYINNDTLAIIGHEKIKAITFKVTSDKIYMNFDFNKCIISFIFKDDYKYNLKILCDKFNMSKISLYNILPVPNVLIDLIESYTEYNVHEELTDFKYKNHLRYLSKINKCQIILTLGIQSDDISGTNNYSWNQNIENIPSQPGNMGFIDRTDILLDYIRSDNSRSGNSRSGNSRSGNSRSGNSRSGNSRSGNSRSDRTNWRMW